MTKQLYEEALADVKQVKDVAENNAKRAIMDAVTPRIRELIEEELFREHGEDLEVYDELGASAPAGGEVLVDLVSPSADASPSAAAVSAPDAQGKVTLDLDALTACPTPVASAVEPPVMGSPAPGAEYELSLESIEVLTPVLKEANTNAVQQRLHKLSETVKKLSESGGRIRRTVGNYRKIARMISYVENMYGYVQEAVDDPAQKEMFEKKLETSFADLSRLQESMMAKTKKLQMNEADVSLKLTGLPDDLDLDSVGVDLMTGEDEEGAPGADAGDAGGGDDVDLSGLGGGAQGSEDEAGMGEGLNLSDDTIVEIDETMLRNEIARMRSLREETKPQSWGNGVGANEVDNFGGGKDDGDPVLDHEPTTAGKVGEPLGEADDQMDEMEQVDEDDAQMDEQDDLDEMDDLDQLIRRPREIHHPTHAAPEEGMDEMEGMDQLQNRRKDDMYGSDVADSHVTPTWDKRRHESLGRRAAFEKRLQERAKARAAALKNEHAKTKDAKKSASLKKEYADVAKRFNESLSRSKKISKQIAESKKLYSESLQNGASRQPAEQAENESLRKKLAETNLFNAKLIATNKLLQNDSLTSRQKAQVIEQLEGANSLREVKLVYDSLVKTLKPVRPLAEGADRKVVGSASRATRPASTQALNEGIETERWARLAGIVK